jgi:glycosyltransferase involved in cell wall biosynthesis
MISEIKQSLISIFMPVYNGSEYLKKSVESIINQTYRNFELLCVDDSSTDDSYEILKQFAEKDLRIKIFQKPHGGNVPKSWNFVMPFLAGESIVYMSQDDLMSEDNLEQMYKRQQETNADCVLSDMVWFYEDRQDNKIIAGVDGNRDIVLTNREAVILSLNWKIHGFALWKSGIVNDEIVPEDSFSNDEYFIRKLFFKSNKVVFCKGIFFYRQDNKNAITKTFGINNYYSVLTVHHIYKLLEGNHFESTVVDSYLIAVFRTYYKLYRFFSLRKAINSELEFKKIRSMFFDFYPHLNKRKLIETARRYSGRKRMKINLIWLLFSSFSFFRLNMFLVCLFNRSSKSAVSVSYMC